MLIRHFRQVPLLIKVAGVLALVCSATAIVLSANLFMLLQQSYPAVPVVNDRMQTLSMGLGELSLACTLAVGLYSTRIRKAPPEPFPPGAPLPTDSWKRQLVTILIPAMFPLCVITLALILPLGSPLIGIAFVLGAIGGLALLAEAVYVRFMPGDTLLRTPHRW